ncbi:MAG: pyridoxal-phosphate dependent enzyme, partial [Candidatus Methanomethylicia archaeon]
MIKSVDSIFDLIGNTPLLKLSKISRGVDANIFVKCEFMNPSGSIKDRAALRMINDA